MKTNKYFIALFSLSAVLAFADDKALDRSPAWTQVLDSEQGQYSVNVEAKQKKIEVTQVEEKGKSAPKYLRLRVLRKNDRPLEIHLRTIDTPGSPVRYTGQLNPWSESNVGLQLEFSFDKKTWKRLGKKLNALLP